MDFSFNLINKNPYAFSRIDRYFYKFTSTNGIVYKLDFKHCEFEAPVIEYKKYNAYELALCESFNNFKKYDEQVFLTCLHIIRDFLQQQVTANAMLVYNENLLTQLGYKHI